MKNSKAWPITYSCKLMEAGIISYEDSGAGIAYLTKQTIDKIVPTIIGKPVVIRHQHVTPQNHDKVAVGYVTGVRFDPADAWFYVDFLITSDEVEAIDRDGCVVFKAPDGETLDGISGAYDVLNTSDGGVWHDIKFDAEILDGSFTHLALVVNPRYEETNQIRQQMNFMLVNGKQAHQQKQEESQMNIFKIFRKVTNGKAEEIMNASVDVDGKEVPVKELIDTYKAEETEKAEKAKLDAENAKKNEKPTDDDEVEVDGKKVKVSELKNCYKAKMAKKNAKAKENGKSVGMYFKDKGRAEEMVREFESNIEGKVSIRQDGDRWYFGASNLSDDDQEVIKSVGKQKGGTISFTGNSKEDDDKKKKDETIGDKEKEEGDAEEKALKAKNAKEAEEKEAKEKESKENSYGNYYIHEDIQKGADKKQIIKNIQARYPDIDEDQAGGIYEAVAKGGPDAPADWSKKKKNAKAEEDKAAEEKKNSEEAEAKAKAEKEAEEKKNSKTQGDEYFKQLQNAGKNVGGEEASAAPMTRSERANVGKQRYGSKNGK